MDLSCIIVNYHNSNTLKDCLESIYQTIKEIEFEVIVVDNSQNDPGIEPLKVLYKQTQFISNGANVGFAKGNNQAAKIAQGDIFLILNPDTVLSSQAINKMYDHLKTHPEIGAIGPKVLDPDGSLQYSCRRYPTLMTGLFNRYSFLSKMLPNNPYTRHYLMTDFDHQKILEVDWVSGCCLMTPRTAFEKAGGFDENYFLFNEDIDLCRAIHNLSLKVVYYPFVEIFHLVSSSNQKLSPGIIIKRHRGMSHYYNKHHGENLLTRGIVYFFISLRCLSQLTLNIFK